MTTNTKVAAAAAILLAVTVPNIYQRQRIAALEKELLALHHRVSLPSPQAPSAAMAGKRAVAAKIQDRPDPASSGRPDISGPVMDKDGPLERDAQDHDALNSEKVKEKLAALRKRLSLTPEQETKIAKALEYGQSKMRIIPNGSILTRATPEDKQKMADGINAALTAEQQKEYEAFRAEETANAIEAGANRELSSLQSMTTLSPEQKDQAFAALSEICSKEYTQTLPMPDGDPEALKEALNARWTARQEALGGILTPEQMTVYQQAGNPFQLTRHALPNPGGADTVGTVRIIR